MRTTSEKVFAPIDPVVDDAIFAGLKIEEAIDVTHDGDIEIQKKCRPHKIAEAIVCYHQFDQDMWPMGAHAGVLWKCNDLNFGIQSRCVLRAAEKAKWPFEVSPHGAMEDVYIFRRVAGSPFEAEDIDGLRHGGRMIAVD
jgi:hypothetical protein